MSKSGSVAEIDGFMRWALNQNDDELTKSTFALLFHWYHFAKLSFGGQEYAFQQELFQVKADSVVVRAMKINRHMVPLAMQIIAAPRQNDELILQLARACVATVCEILDMPPLETCSPPCSCAASSAPPA